MPRSLPLRRRPLAGAAAAAALAASLGAPLAATPPARPDPTDARSPVPPLQHQSAFGSYRRNADTPVGAWRAMNDATARAGGWRAYARESNAQDHGTASAPADAATPASASGPASASAPASAPARTAPGHQHHHHGGHRP